jgi:hypothetical protein
MHHVYLSVSSNLMARIKHLILDLNFSQLRCIHLCGSLLVVSADRLPHHYLK